MSNYENVLPVKTERYAVLRVSDPTGFSVSGAMS